MIKKDIITLIEITDTHVKLLQAKPLRGGALLTFADMRKIEQFTDEHVTDLLVPMIKERDIDPDHLAVVIPRRFVILKQIRLPSHSEEEIHRMAGLQLSSYTPYAREDVIFHPVVLEKEAGGYARVLLVILHKDVAHRYLKIFEKTKLSPHHLVFSSFGVLENYAYHSHRQKIRAEKPVILISIDMISSEICFCQGHKLLFSRQISFGGRDLTPESLPPYLEQISLTLGSYKKERLGSEWGKVVLLTDIPEASILKDRLNEYYALPVDIINPTENLPTVKGADPLFFRSFSGVSWAVAIGFLFSDITKQINFIPEDVQLIKKGRLARKAWIKLGVMFLMVFVLAMGALEASIYPETNYLHRLEERLADLKPKASQAEKKVQFLNRIKEGFSRRVLIADVIRALYEVSPPEMTFTSLNFDSKGSLVIQGSVPSGMSVNAFQGSLVKNALFKDVNLEYATKRRRIDGEYTDFKIVCKLMGQEGDVHD